jgi:hypothetical protein
MRGINLILDLGSMFLETVKDVAPIIMLIAFFQIMIIRKPFPNMPKVFMGFIFVIIGLALFLLGLEKALFPIGDMMATQLSNPEFVKSPITGEITWSSYYWIYLFAAMIGFATTIAEPSLKAVAMKANEVSGGSISEWTLRLTVALGAGIALALGTFRIITGTPLYYYLLVCYLIVIVQTIFAPKNMVALAYDSGGVTTSTVTVPIVAALGLGLSSVVPGSNPALDGFGMIALVCMFPIITVLGYAQIIDIIKKLTKK